MGACPFNSLPLPQAVLRPSQPLSIVGGTRPQFFDNFNVVHGPI